MYGRVTNYFTDRGYGFICGEDRNSYFVHHSQLEGEYLDRGYYVSFKPYKNDRSDFNAGNIVVIETPDKISNRAAGRKKIKNSNFLFLIGSVKKFVSLEKNTSFLARISI